ncbi:MAG: DUF421 domain-containing protein [Clostridia bacterium]|nr:DUF421 domain-containing protein [Clostridia bacterium]
MAFVIFRSVILYFVVAIALRVMGKRQIGELQPSELVITLLFSELASVPMQSPDLPLLSGILPILALAAIEIAISTITLKSVKLRYALYGKPVILIYNGKIDQKAMEKARVTIDDMTEAMRTSGVTRIEDINYAILETNGNMSVIPKEKTDTQSGLSTVIIVDGRVIEENLTGSKSEKWLKNVIESQNIKSEKDIFLLSRDDSGKIFLVKKDDKD